MKVAPSGGGREVRPVDVDDPVQGVGDVAGRPRPSPIRTSSRPSTLVASSSSGRGLTHTLPSGWRSRVALPTRAAMIRGSKPVVSRGTVVRPVGELDPERPRLVGHEGQRVGADLRDHLAGRPGRVRVDRQVLVLDVLHAADRRRVDQPARGLDQAGQLAGPGGQPGGRVGQDARACAAPGSWWSATRRAGWASGGRRRGRPAPRPGPSTAPRPPRGRCGAGPDRRPRRTSSAAAGCPRLRAGADPAADGRGQGVEVARGDELAGLGAVSSSAGPYRTS